MCYGGEIIICLNLRSNIEIIAFKLLLSRLHDFNETSNQQNAVYEITILNCLKLLYNSKSQLSMKHNDQI